MNKPSHVLKYLKDKSESDPNHKFSDIYRNFYNLEFYLEAYKNITKSKGSMTPGSDGETLDGMSLERINKIIESMKNGTYQPTPARRVYIQKKNSDKKRPLGIPSTDDKLVQEMVRMFLSEIYEPRFSNCSHGFRPNRSCHTALESIKNTFTGVKWIIEGDIKACFDSFDHEVLIGLLERRIRDSRFINLVRKMLKAGYMEQWTYKESLSGTPQGSGVSPILANIYMTELDAFIAELGYLFDTPAPRRKSNPQYNNISQRLARIKKKLASKKGDHESLIKKLKLAQKQLLNTQPGVTFDLIFKRLKYNRYADDFIVGIIGSKWEAEIIKQAIKKFLTETLKLTLSEEKTKITHSGKMFRYLGFDITVSRSQATKRDKNGVLKRAWTGKVQLYVPQEKWLNKLKQYEAISITMGQDKKETWVAQSRRRLVNKTVRCIIEKFNAEISGLYNFYQIAENVSTLHHFFRFMKSSMLKTLAVKFNMSVTKVMKKFAINGIIGVDYETKEGTKRREFYHDGFTKKEINRDVEDVVAEYLKYEKPNRLAGRLMAGLCEVCGCRSDNIQMHHIKALKNLANRNKFEVIMKKRNTKSLALCPECFEKAQASK